MRKATLFLIAGLLSACAELSQFGSGQHASDPESSKRLHNLMQIAKATEQAGDMKAATKLYQDAVEYESENAEARLALAEAYLRHGKSPEAIAVLQQAKETYPDNTSLAYEVGKRLINADAPDEALLLYTQAMEKDPKNPDIKNGRAIALDMLGKHQEAQSFYRQALEQLPPKDQAMISNNLALSYLMSGDPEKAVRILEPLIMQSSADSLTHNLALAYGLSGQFDKAKKLGLKDLNADQMEENIAFYQYYLQHYKRQSFVPVPSTKPAQR